MYPFYLIGFLADIDANASTGYVDLTHENAIKFKELFLKLYPSVQIDLTKLSQPLSSMGSDKPPKHTNSSQGSQAFNDDQFSRVFPAGPDLTKSSFESGGGSQW